MFKVMKLNEIIKGIILYLDSQDKGTLILEVKETRKNQVKDTEKEQPVK